MSKVRHPGIQQTKDTRGGQARMKGTRITVQEVMHSIVRGDTVEKIASDYNLKTWQVQDAVQYAARCAKRFDP